MVSYRFLQILVIILLVSFNASFGINVHDSECNPVKDHISHTSKARQVEQQIWLKVDVDRDSELFPLLLKVVKKRKIGGIVFSGHNMNALVNILEELKSKSKSDILFAVDGEYGIGKHFKLSKAFPSNETLASITDSLLQKKVVSVLSDQLKTLGIQINIADFKDEDTGKKIKALFLENQIFVSSPVEKLIPDKTAKQDSLYPQLFFLTNDLEKEIDYFLKEVKTQYKSKKESKLAIRSYAEKIQKVREQTKCKYLRKEDVTSVCALVNASNSKVLSREAYRFGSVLLKNENDFLPIPDLGKQKIAYVSFSDKRENQYFGNILSKYTKLDCYQYIQSENDSVSNKLFKDLKQYNLIILGIFDDKTNCNPALDKLMFYVTEEQNVVNSFFGTSDVSQATRSNAVLYSYDSDSLTQSYAAQIIFGGISSGAKLSYSLKEYPRGSGLTTKGGTRFEYTIPEMAGVDGDYLSFEIDSLANMAIDVQAFPGCQVLVAKDRKIIYHQSFGYHTYYKDQKVTNNDIYDLASVTKITGTLPALMQFVDQKKIDLDHKFSEYWEDFKGTNKEDLYFREILAHQSGLQSWIPFWKNTVDSLGNYLPNIYSTVATDTFSVPIFKHLFLNKNYHKVMFHDINESLVSSEKKYVYSGLPFYIFPKLIEQITKQEYPEYIQQSFYRPLGAYNIIFNAGQVFPVERIIPTEYDSSFRCSLLHGSVDDEGAAMMGGISGNAGLFSDANDLAKLLQMYLQMGEYGGKRYISEKTMREFTRYQFPENENRRGLGFDKPELGNDTLNIENCYPAYSASTASFGHSGYTGTFVWCDPESQLVYIFLSNRVYPSRKNSKIYETNVRIRIHEAIYESIDRFKNKNIVQ